MPVEFDPAVAPRVAFRFGTILREWLTAEERAEILRLNTAETNPHICHSHDVCDPNQAILDACEETGVALEVNDDRFFDLANAAWPVAIAMLDDERGDMTLADVCDCCRAPVESMLSSLEGNLAEYGYACAFCGTSTEYSYGAYRTVVAGIEYCHSWRDTPERRETEDRIAEAFTAVSRRFFRE